MSNRKDSGMNVKGVWLWLSLVKGCKEQINDSVAWLPGTQCAGRHWSSATTLELPPLICGRAPGLALWNTPLPSDPPAGCAGFSPRGPPGRCSEGPFQISRYSPSHLLPSKTRQFLVTIGTFIYPPHSPPKAVYVRPFDGLVTDSKHHAIRPLFFATVKAISPVACAAAVHWRNPSSQQQKYAESLRFSPACTPSLAATNPFVVWTGSRIALQDWSCFSCSSVNPK